MPNYVRQTMWFKGPHNNIKKLLDMILVQEDENFPDHNVKWIDECSVTLWMETPWSIPERWWQDVAKEARKLNVTMEGDYAEEFPEGAMGHISMREDNDEEPLFFEKTTQNRALMDMFWGEGYFDMVGGIDG